MELNGKVAIVTGASAGTGRAYALALAGAGATVIAAARSLGRFDGETPQRNTLAEVVQAGDGLTGRIYAQACDLEVEADIARMTEQAVANFGRIDILVNNAGIYPHYPPLAITTAEWDLNMRVNIRGPYLTIRHAAPHMIRQRSGSIINLASGSAEFRPKGHLAHDNLLAYGVSKAGLNRLTTYMAEELKPHAIAVNALSPGAVVTDTFVTSLPDEVESVTESGWGKPPTAEVMGPALLYLARQTAETLTGQILHTDEFRKSWP
jgi:NAD(P)-dependent dehydrogenase (short-subunit alcohol dehydrogenase family)